MGFCKKCCLNCLAMCCLIPMAWISFTVFDLGAAITGGALVNLGDAITIAMTMAMGSQGGGAGMSVIVGGFIRSEERRLGKECTSRGEPYI